MSDPTKGITDLAQRAKDDVDELAHFVTKAAADTAHEGIGLTSDAAQVVLDLIESTRASLVSLASKVTSGGK